MFVQSVSHLLIVALIILGNVAFFVERRRGKELGHGTARSSTRSRPLLTIAIFSFLWKDNPIYKFAEHLVVGVSAGYWSP